MAVEIADKPDRVHVRTGRAVWTILRDPAGGRGPCTITDLRQQRRPYRPVVTDSAGDGHTLNNPCFGGLFAVGLVVAVPPGPDPDPATFWEWGWEITTRPTGRHGFGPANPTVDIIDNYRVQAGCDLLLRGQPIARLQWLYRFQADDSVRCTIGITPAPLPGGWLKEPKVTFNGLHGYRIVRVTDEHGRLLDRQELDRYRNPAHSTLQIPHPARHGYRFVGGVGTPGLTITVDHGLAGWANAADQAGPMTGRPMPVYCLNHQGRLWQRTEIARNGDLDQAGLMAHGWEGGAGAPDCLGCFRPWPATPAVVDASARLL